MRNLKFLFALLGASIFIISCISVVNFTRIVRNSDDILYVEEEFKKIDDVFVPFLVHANTLRLDTSQVQKFLTDAALTKRQKSRDEAEEWAKKFYADAAEAKKGAETISRRDIASGIGQIESEFDTFYSLGKIMADFYISNDLAKGSEANEKFNSMALEIIKSIDSTQQNAIFIEKKHINSINVFLNNMYIKGSDWKNYVGIAFILCVLSCFVMIVLLGSMSEPKRPDSYHGPEDQGLGSSSS